MAEKPSNRLRNNDEPKDPKPKVEATKSRSFELPSNKNLLYGAAAIIGILLIYGVFQMRKPSNYTTFLKESRLEILMEEKKYDSALTILDSVLKKDIFIKEKATLVEFRNTILKQKFEKEAISKNFFADCVDLMKAFRFDEAYAKSEQAIAAGAVQPHDKVMFDQFSAEIRAARDSFQKNAVFKIPIDHKVKSGENLSMIATQYEMKISEIKKLNNISADWIREGQQITVWGMAKVGEHKVGAGENITAIASKYKMSVKNFKLINHLESDIIKEGQKLKTITYMGK